MRLAHRPVRMLSIMCATAVLATAAMAQDPIRIAGTTCEVPPVLRCPEEGCVGAALALVTEGGPVSEPKTGRNFFLDYPCDLRPGEAVTVIMSHTEGLEPNVTE